MPVVQGQGKKSDPLIACSGLPGRNGGISTEAGT